MDIQVTVVDEDVSTLAALATEEFRGHEGQASYLLQKALRAARAKANAPERTRGPSRTRQPLPRPTNGVAVAH